MKVGDCEIYFECTHTFNLSFLLHGQDFRKPNFTPKKTTKDTKNTKNFSEKVKCMQFFHPIWKNLHLTEIFYTGTACDACDKLKVCENTKGNVPKFCQSLFPPYLLGWALLGLKHQLEVLSVPLCLFIVIWLSLFRIKKFSCHCRLQMKPGAVLFLTIYDMFVVMLESLKHGCF